MSDSVAPATGLPLRFRIHGQAADEWVIALRRWFRRDDSPGTTEFFWDIRHTNEITVEDDLVLWLVTPTGIADTMRAISHFPSTRRGLWLAGGLLSPPEQRILLELGIRGVISSPSKVPEAMRSTVNPWLARQIVERSHSRGRA